MAHILPKTLWRRMERRFAEGLTERGEIKFSPLTYYQRLEGVRGDDQEGTRKRNAAGSELSIQDPISGVWSAPIKMISGRVGEHLRNPECSHITCFSLTAESSEDFGDTLIEVFDPQGLSNYFGDWLHNETRCQLEFGAVSYFDETGGEESFPTPQPHLSKRMKYSHESEFRLFFFCDMQILANHVSATEGRPFVQNVNENLHGIVFESGSLRDYMRIV